MSEYFRGNGRERIQGTGGRRADPNILGRADAISPWWRWRRAPWCRCTLTLTNRVGSSWRASWRWGSAARCAS